MNVQAIKFDIDKAIKLINQHRAVHLGKNPTENFLKKEFVLTEKAQKIAKKAAKKKGFDNDSVTAGTNTYQVCASFGAQLTAKQVIDAW